MYDLKKMENSHKHYIWITQLLIEIFIVIQKKKKG